MSSRSRFSWLVPPLLLVTLHAQRGGDRIERIREAELKVDLFGLRVTTRADAREARSTS